MHGTATGDLELIAHSCAASGALLTRNGASPGHTASGRSGNSATVSHGGTIAATGDTGTGILAQPIGAGRATRRASIDGNRLWNTVRPLARRDGGALTGGTAEAIGCR
jgi:hypothetical protein